MRERRIVTPWRIHTPRLREDRGLFLSSTIRFTGEEVSLRSPLRSSSGNSSRSRQRISAELCGRRGCPTLCFLSGNRDHLQEGSAVVLLRTRPAASTLQTIAVVESQFSWTFPAHPRSLASVLIPRPAARRVSASHGPELLKTVGVDVLVHAPFGFRLSKNLCATNAKDFPNLPKKTPLDLGSGAHSRRFAQECPEGNTGKSNKEK